MFLLSAAKLPETFGSLIAVFLCGLLLACQPPADALPQPEAASVSAHEDSGQQAERIISLAPHLTELVYAAGAGERLVATVEYSDFPAAALELPRIGDAFRINYEALAVLNPDLLLAWESGTPREVVQRLESLGYRVVMLESAKINDIAAELLQIGQLAGSSAVAIPQAQQLQDEINELRQRYSHQSTVSVYFQISAEPYISVTGQHVISDIIELCGGSNIFANLPGVAPPVSVESILAANPDVILATAFDNNGVWKEKWRIWQQLSAVQQSQLFSIDWDLIARPGPRIVEGAAQICAALESARNSKAQDLLSGGG